MNDFKLNDDGDLLIRNGDLAIGDSVLQHQRHILIAHKGEYKEYPEIGIGIAGVLNDENPRLLLNEVRRNFEYDGMQVMALDIKPDGSIYVDALYNSI